MRVGLIGAVNSTSATLNSLIEHQMNIVLVMGYEPKNSTNVSGWSDLRQISQLNGLNYIGFSKINQHVEDIKAADLDVLFVVGLSQLVSQDIIDAARVGTVGFHPTDLPKGRGRAPIAWLVANKEDGAANFFVINEIADSGPILVKQRFSISDNDDAADVEAKILVAIKEALDQWLPKLKAGLWDPVPQQHDNASEYGVRKPEDGLIRWEDSAYNIDRLIKAAAPPHPGAFSFIKGGKVLLLRSRVEPNLDIQGCVGRVLKVVNGELLVQTGNGLIWIEKYQLDGKEPRVGDKLGYFTELEIFNLYQQIEEIKTKLGV